MSVNHYIGMTIEEASHEAKLAGLEVAIEVIGGPQNLNNEYRQGRINFKIEHGLIMEAHLG